MRHRYGLRKLNRTTSHRLAMLRNMACSLLIHEAIKTTLPKAKELRRVVEPMITLAKHPSLANRRNAFNRLRDRDVVVKLFDVLGPRFAKRNGGYTRILKMGFRDGDNAPMAYVELTEKAEVVEAVEEKKPVAKAAAKSAEKPAEKVEAAAEKAPAKKPAAKKPAAKKPAAKKPAAKKTTKKAEEKAE